MLTWLASSPSNVLAAIAVTSVVAGGAGATITYVVTPIVVSQPVDDSQPPAWLRAEHERRMQLMRDDTAALRRMIPGGGK